MENNSNPNPLHSQICTGSAPKTRTIDPNEHREMFPVEGRERFESLNILEGGFLVCPPFWSVIDLRYSYHRLYYICGGEAYYIEDNRRVELKKGFLYIFPSQTRQYAIRHDPQDPLKALWCHFEIIPDMLNDLIEVNVMEYPHVFMSLQLLQKTVELPLPKNEMSCIVTLILCLLERRLPFKYADFPFEGIEHYISKHIQDNLTVASLADHFGYARSHFSRKFKAAYERSPGEYLKTVRMSRAANMLSSGFTISQICASLGYSDKKVFTRAFKNYHGLPPSYYQKKHNMQP